ncbi:MAG: hypothetical protein HY807_06005 [Nitrospirae bacterium]|nr:hypothetical protein [Nitrospirota bacterium]
MAKAIALYSGGLDSTLAILAVMKQGVEVTAITFMNHFGCSIGDKSSCSKDPFSASLKFGFDVKLSHLSDKFLEIVKNPKFGHGRNMNPCLDCRILMLREAKAMMEMSGADFLVTGEVIGQRPMSQRRDTFPVIDREANVKGLVLRPLTAKHLKITIPEEKGMVNRDLLYDFFGRSRKPQMALAAEFGLTEYPAPAGGCLLTEPNYSFRLKELFSHISDPSYKDINLLRLGRHFRLSPECKVIVGRKKEENDAILSLVEDADYTMHVPGYGSPVTLVSGAQSDEILNTAASLCARYSDAKNLDEVDVLVKRGDEIYPLKVKPATDEILKQYAIVMN